jgi:transcriptional regulator with XRE-family HTH domain
LRLPPGCRSHVASRATRNEVGPGGGWTPPGLAPKGSAPMQDEILPHAGPQHHPQSADRPVEKPRIRTSKRRPATWARAAELRALGAAVRELRARRGYSQEALGYYADLHRNYVGGIERGELNVTFRILLNLAHGLTVPLSELIWIYERNPRRAAVAMITPINTLAVIGLLALAGWLTGSLLRRRPHPSSRPWAPESAPATAARTRRRRARRRPCARPRRRSTAPQNGSISIHEIAAILCDRLGQHVTVYLVAADPQQIAAYAHGADVPDVHARRLRAGFKIVHMIEAAYTPRRRKPGCSRPTRSSPSRRRSTSYAPPPTPRSAQRRRRPSWA